MRTLQCGSGRVRAPRRDRSRRARARRCRESTTTRTHRSWSPASAATGAAGSGLGNEVDNVGGNEVGNVIRSDVTQRRATQNVVIQTALTQASAPRLGRLRATPRRSRTTAVAAAATAAKS